MRHPKQSWSATEDFRCRRTSRERRARGTASRAGSLPDGRGHADGNDRRDGTSRLRADPVGNETETGETGNTTETENVTNTPDTDEELAPETEPEAKDGEAASDTEELPRNSGGTGSTDAGGIGDDGSTDGGTEPEGGSDTGDGTTEEPSQPIDGQFGSVD